VGYFGPPQKGAFVFGDPGSPRGTPFLKEKFLGLFKRPSKKISRGSEKPGGVLEHLYLAAL